MSLEKFYYDLLHINQSSISEPELISKIESIVKEQMKTIGLYSDTMEGLCKVASYQIGERLKENGIAVEVINTKQLLGVYEHVALIVTYPVEEQIKYILIGPTYQQFVPIGSAKLNPILSEWPGKRLKEKNFALYQNLISCGYSKIGKQDWFDYLESFSNILEKENLTLETLWGVKQTHK